MLFDRWMDKEDAVYMYNGVSASHKKWNPAICDNIDGPGGYYVKWHQSGRERQILHDFTYMWNLEKKKNKCNRTGTE